MKFRETLNIIEGLRFIADELTIMSALGRSSLMDSDFIEDPRLLERHYDNLCRALNVLENSEAADAVGRMRHLLMQARDLHTTVRRLGDSLILDDVELFEIKGLTLLSKEIRGLLPEIGFETVKEIEMPDLGKILEILDPEKTGNAHFHIYDAYSEELAEKRKELKRLQASEKYDTEENDRLITECMMLEERVRETLSEKLRPYASKLDKTLESIGRIDLLLAKGFFAKRYRLAIPALTETYLHYSGLRYLPAESRLEEQGKEFQPIDLSLKAGVTLITGANMGGKTITLKSLAMAQAMAQFGFGIPAKKGGVAPVSKIAISIGDGQSAKEGLSSFGSEILNIDKILTDASGNERMLILIDEPARTTNPEEGKAIVCAIIETLQPTRSISILTTHYSNVRTSCRRLKVRGVTDSIHSAGIDIQPGSLGNYMDYSIVADDGSDIDREALTIARLLGISRNFSDSIEKNIQNINPYT